MYQMAVEAVEPWAKKLTSRNNQRGRFSDVKCGDSEYQMPQRANDTENIFLCKSTIITTAQYPRSILDSDARPGPHLPASITAAKELYYCRSKFGT